MNNIYVLDSEGKKKPFSFQKIYRSARRAGVPGALAEKIAQTIKKEAFPGIKTSEIFEKVKIIENSNISVATREKVIPYSWQNISEKIIKTYTSILN